MNKDVSGLVSSLQLDFFFASVPLNLPSYRNVVMTSHGTQFVVLGPSMISARYRWAHITPNQRSHSIFNRWNNAYLIQSHSYKLYREQLPEDLKASIGVHKRQLQREREKKKERETERVRERGLSSEDIKVSRRNHQQQSFTSLTQYFCGCSFTFPPLPLPLPLSPFCCLLGKSNNKWRHHIFKQMSQGRML